MPTMARDGADIAYNVEGQGMAGLPVLLTHGMYATAAMWSSTVQALSATRPVVTWDMRGHGQSGSPAKADSYSEALTVADMTAILDAIGAERAVLAGMSLGGYMTLAFRLAHPERVAALILCDTGPGFRRPDARAAWNHRAEAQAVRLETEGLAALPLSREVSPSDHAGTSGLALAARGMLKQNDDRVVNLLPEISEPTLIIVGSDDEAFLPAADYMNAKIPASTKVVIPDAGHAANIDQPKLFNQAVLEFLADLAQ